jgi:flagellar hook-associated protein 2
MGSTSSSASSITAPITFSGSSSYSSSFQQVLQRAVSIASLPMVQLQNNVNDLENQQSDLSSLQATFASLQNSLQDIATATTGSVSASSSDSSIVTAAAATNTLPGVYSIQVDDAGSPTTTISNATATPVTDAGSGNISSSLNYTLNVNGATTQITLTSDTLQALATAINDSGAGVSATIVNLGSNSSPDYRLSVTGNDLGSDQIQLNDGTNDLLGDLQGGTPATYQLNGNSTVLSSSSDQVTLAPGLTATLVSASPGTTVNITVAASEDALSTALSNFATAYNSAVSALSNEHGQSGGALVGQSVVFELSDALSHMVQYGTGTGSIQDLGDLGLDLDSTGNLSFDASQFASQSSAGIQQFLGGIATGGFLQTANDALSSVADPTSGALATEISSVQTAIASDNSQIADEQSRVNDMQTALQAQLSAADAAIAVLQQQQTFYTNLFATENANNSAGLG